MQQFDRKVGLRRRKHKRCIQNHTCGRRLGCVGRDGHRIRVQGHLKTTMQRGEDAGRLGGARILRPQCEQVVDVLRLEEALLLWVSQHLQDAAMIASMKALAL